MQHCVVMGYSYLLPDNPNTLLPLKISVEKRRDTDMHRRISIPTWQCHLIWYHTSSSETQVGIHQPFSRTFQSCSPDFSILRHI